MNNNELSGGWLRSVVAAAEERFSHIKLTVETLGSQVDDVESGVLGIAVANLRQALESAIDREVEMEIRAGLEEDARLRKEDEEETGYW